MSIHVYFVLIPLLLLIAAIFAASEASLFSLSRTQLETIKNSKPNLYKSIKNLLQKPEGLLSTLIISNEVINILIGTFVVTLLQNHLNFLDSTWIALLSVFVSTLLLLVFSEILPKVLGFRLPVLAATILVYPTSWAHFLLTPVRKVFISTSSEILKLFNIKTDSSMTLSERDLINLIEVGEESGSLDQDEKQMIFNVFKFSDRSVQSVITPWNRVFTLTEGCSVSDALSKVRQNTFSRIPVISQSDQSVTGVLYTKELLKLLLNSEFTVETDAIKKATFAPYIVSSHKKVSKLFREFKQKKIHMALVVNEYGHYLGVVTLEDLLNSLFQTQNKSEIFTS
ncbi:MAG: HlyC/CorC family transporter [Deltaproteobacteria bacterium]|nr:HlyC/CorC family transporter [Deltaproteobacteria bacterium]